MERKLAILRPFFENPDKRISLRELSRIVRINHTTVRKHADRLVKEGVLASTKEGVYSFFTLVLSKKTLNLKLFYNLEKLRQSNLVEELEKQYDLPVIVLFGSYATAMDDETSDVDVCVITNVKKEFAVEAYEKALNRSISIRKFDKKSWAKLKKSNKNFVNSICNGIVLSGELEVL